MNKLLRKILFAIFSLVEISLVLRFLLKLFGTSSEAGFISFVYENTNPLLSPFILVFPHPSVSGKFVLEFTTLFAIFVYAFANYLIKEILDFLSSKK
jgi:hypothetical protein